MLENEFELNEIDENLLGASMATQRDLWDARVAEIEKLANDWCHAFEPIAKDQWDGKTLHYHWVDTI